MNSSLISSGSSVIDELLQGGFEKDVVTTLYGPAGSGKTNICHLFAISCVRQGKKIIFIDSEGGFSVERIKQLAPNDYEQILNKIIFLTPHTFDEQRNVFEKLEKLISEDLGAIICDTISMLYRLEMGKSDDIYKVNRELGFQIAYLTEISRKHKIPVIVANQVYANFEDKCRTNMVGGDILKYGSKCLIELSTHPRFRVATIRKHRFLPEGRTVEFKIINEGLQKVDQINQQ